MGLGDAKLAASVGAVLGWISWQTLLTGAFAAFALAAVHGGVLLAWHRAARSSHLPLGPYPQRRACGHRALNSCRFQVLMSSSV